LVTLCHGRDRLLCGANQFYANPLCHKAAALSNIPREKSRLGYLQSLTEYWHDRYDWRREEAALNQLPHYRLALDGFHLHFVHVRGKGPSPLPLILTHGWPGSFVEMIKLLPLLTDPAAEGGQPEDAFDVIVPSLPGYGFSDRPQGRGMSPQEIAELWMRLMQELGYTRFGA
jgi:Epoxide hydrolase N terminus